MSNYYFRYFLRHSYKSKIRLFSLYTFWSFAVRDSFSNEIFIAPMYELMLVHFDPNIQDPEAGQKIQVLQVCWYINDDLLHVPIIFNHTQCIRYNHSMKIFILTEQSKQHVRRIIKWTMHNVREHSPNKFLRDRCYE